MHTENTVYIRGDSQRIFQLASEIQEWPALLPHYRSVKILEQSPDGRRKTAVMAAVRDDFPCRAARFPVRWSSVQVCEPDQGRIIFKHTGGLAVGMWVVWTLRDDPWERGVRVTIRHDLRYPVSLLNGWFAKDLVGRRFVADIAGRTLATIKAKVESEGRP